MNFFAGEITEVADGRVTFRGRSGIKLMLPQTGALPLADGTVTLGVRPEHLRLADPAASSLCGDVSITEHLGGETFLHVALPAGETIVVELSGQADTQPGERVGLEVEPGKHHFFARDGAVVAAIQ